ncbi:hypothetical protein COEREDRAFT_94738 [Coemansia reversa NRRL 1564]|uniref:PP1-binding domain-containing protein n=1 Tax=Coemansia reversa (strain ATCC 12441 / NRRL 1564) TaxID=763665 RepID=A0A2G5B2E2_COERN|nr:hypothetical protein COEREDRAFT_94738 [Coemansia reversa NRRL 1564]|eukprot:PIA13165.1 hypothetical protein COEREDRAFT_94738 [Coemansia reversa NRRL 1564]
MRQVLLKGVSSTARKSVRFGPPLSPELFDTHAPPSTPIRRGTPMQIARMSSILRQQSESIMQSATPLPFSRTRHTGRVGKQPATVAVPRNRRLFRNHSSTGSNGVDDNSAEMADSSLLQSLLQPKRTRRREMMEYFARLESSNWNLDSSSEKLKQHPHLPKKEEKDEKQLQLLTTDIPTGTDTGRVADRRMSQTGVFMDELFDMEGASADVDEQQSSYSPISVPIAQISDNNNLTTPATPLPLMSPMTRALVSAVEKTAACQTLRETITPQRLGRSIEISEPPMEEEESETSEPEIVGIDSPSKFGSPIDRKRKRQRRRSLRPGDSVHRASLESPVLFTRNDMSPSLLVQTRNRRLSNEILPPPFFRDTSPSKQQENRDSVLKAEVASARKERRRTAPAFDGSIYGGDGCCSG